MQQISVVLAGTCVKQSAILLSSFIPLSVFDSQNYNFICCFVLRVKVDLSHKMYEKKVMKIIFKPKREEVNNWLDRTA
jgi:hypothetical protein